MKNLDDLIDSAAELADHGLSKGEIADELNVSRETASWLVDQSAAGTESVPTTAGPHDIHVDWSAIGRDSTRLSAIGSAMADLLVSHAPTVDLTIGIEKAGVPLATVVAHQLEADLASYAPSKHQWDDDKQDLEGSFSRNFAQIDDRECYIVDDTITSGTTITETVEAVRAQGGEPVGCVVLTDKRGMDEVDGVPVYSLLEVIRVGED